MLEFYYNEDKFIQIEGKVGVAQTSKISEIISFYQGRVEETTYLSSRYLFQLRQTRIRRWIRFQKPRRSKEAQKLTFQLNDLTQAKRKNFSLRSWRNFNIRR